MFPHSAFLVRSHVTDAEMPIVLDMLVWGCDNSRLLLWKMLARTR